MAAVKELVPPLLAGDTLTWEEFERRWDATPELKFAELIGGKVYMPPPLSVEHGERDADVIFFFRHYAIGTPGTKVATNATCRMLEDAPQPDACLRIHEDCGGASRVSGKYLHGTPELVAEVCVSSAAYDLHEKRELYQHSGVQEYLAILEFEREIRWFRLKAGKYVLLKPGADGILRSQVFPGLWLYAQALLKSDMARVVEVLNAGLASAEHAEFAALLNKRKKK